MPSTEFGRVSPETAPYLRRTVTSVTRIAGTVPGLAPSEWGKIAYRVVLAGVLRDWVENGTDGLEEQDERDLTDLVRLSATIALDADYSRRDETFATVVAAMIDDWVRNWNTGDDE
jgi:glucuronate isomerase